MEKIKNNNPKIEVKERRKNKAKRKISILTIMLWVFLISTMITITVKNINKTNALEVREISDENWSIGLVMYDRGSDTPNKAITEFTWNATNSNETKQLCMQINYACTTGKEYQPGEIVIEIPGISKSNLSEYNINYTPTSPNSYENWLSKKVIITADDEQKEIKEYDFSYRYDMNNNIYTFTNNEILELNEHFEGTIQIVYNLEPRFKIKTELEFMAKIKENIENSENIIVKESNICNFHYTSLKEEYTLKMSSEVAPRADYEKIENMLNDYYFVSYSFNINTNTKNGVIGALDINNRSINKEINYDSSCIKMMIPEGCILYGIYFSEIKPNEDKTYYYLQYKNKYYVAYPKSRYNEGDIVTSTAQLWGRYEDEREIQKLSQVESSASLKDLDFEYNGSLYWIGKYSNAININGQELEKNGFNICYHLNAFAFYTDSIMDVEIGDDLLYITRKNGDITRLKDDEYNFTKIEIPVFYTDNKYIGYIGDKLIGYKYEVQVRYKNTNEYVTYSEGVTKDSSEELIFNREDIVGIKLVIKDLDKTLYNKNTLFAILAYIDIYTKDYNIGKLYNFANLQVYKKDNNGTRVLDNKSTIKDYYSFNKDEIAKYDIETYGSYIQRASEITNVVKNSSFKLSTNIANSGSLKNIVKKEKYEAEYKLSSSIQIEYFDVDKDCIIKQYYILPSGTNIVSNKEEIINSIGCLMLLKDLEHLLLKDGTRFIDYKDFLKYIKKNTQVDIDYNYKNSGRTKVSVTYNLSEIDWSYYLIEKSSLITFNTRLKVEIPYNSIAEYGTSYRNYIYAMWGNQEYQYSASIADNGKYDPLANDIDNDGNIDENVAYDFIDLNINHIVSSKQSVIKQVRTDLTKGKFVSETSYATAGSEYTYKLRVATGTNRLKDLIIYDNLETILDSEGNEISDGWRGEFLGVDTTYAKSKGYFPIVYYSDKINPGKLTEESSKWKLLTETTDKSLVKSICVDLRYKEDGSEMELASNDLVYVLVNMRASEDRTLTTSANNMFSTNWRAKDPLGTVIDNIEGIYSNQVNVKIYKEENRKKDIVGKKIWKDSNNKNSKRPKSIIVKLLQDGVEYERCEVTVDDNWEYGFRDIPVYKNSNLEKYEYRVEEEKVPYYEATYDGYDIINTLSGKDISGEKTWNDEWNRYSTRPESVIIKLLQDGIEYRRCEVTGDNNWKYKFEDVPIYKNDNLEEYEYTVEEVKVPGYDDTYNGCNVTNTLKTKTIEVTKIWEDNENEHGLRPKFVKILIYDGENKISEGYVREDTDWKYEFTGLPEFRTDGRKIEYRIDEEVEKRKEEYWGGGYWEIEENFENEGDFELYNKYYVKEIVGNTITNKYVDPDERIKVIGKKVWEDEDNKALKRPNSVVLQIKNGEEIVSEGVVTEDSNWSFEFEAARYDESGSEIKYHIDEGETPKFYEKEIVDDFTVKNKFKVPDDKVKIEVIKLWEDFEDKYKKRPNKVTLQVLSEDKIVAEQVVDEKSNWRHEFELAKYDENGNEIEYRVDEKENIENYEKRISGYTVINKCIYEPVTDTSDINILLYIIIFGLSVMGIIAIGCIVRKKKINNR